MNGLLRYDSSSLHYVEEPPFFLVMPSRLSLDDSASRMWKDGRVLNVVNIVVNPECISMGPADAHKTG